MTTEEAIYTLKNAAFLGTEEALKKDNDAVEMAIDVMEKQIPKKPKGDYHSVPHYRCPVCNKSVKTYEDSYKIPFCCWCGQRLDWTEGAELYEKES